MDPRQRKGRLQERPNSSLKPILKPRRQPGIQKVSVVYYLSRNRQLDHPHFMEVTLSSPDGLYLRDVFDRLDILRGRGMAAMYSWSCKRSYKSGFVWQDLMVDDLVIESAGDYVLKGTELVDWPGQQLNTSDQQQNLARTREASTQTEDFGLEGRQRNSSSCFSEADVDGTGEISPTVSSSSSPVRRMNTLETLIRADVSRMNNYRIFGKEEVIVPSSRLKSVNSTIMQLITCGSFPAKEHHRLGPVWAYNPRFSRVKFSSPVMARSMISGELDLMSESSVKMMQEERRCSAGPEHY